ncbi:MAG: vWA domain-containing protein [Candidatus Binataceae bacterium]
MAPWLIVAIAAAALAIIVAAFVIYRRSYRQATINAQERRDGADKNDPLLGGRRRSIWHVFRFIEGPFEISVALHVVIILALLWLVHMPSGNNLIMVNLRGGGGGGSQELKQLDLPEMAMPEMRMPLPIERPVVASQSSETIATATHYVRSMAGSGIGAGRGGGIGSGYGRGVGAGFGGFIGGLRKSGLEVALVLDGTGSMLRVIGDAKSRMKQLIFAIHRLVPAARIGIVVFGGRGEPIQVQPLTTSPDKLITFLNSIAAHNGGEWQEDTLGAVRTAIDRMAWKPGSHKVIVLVGDTPPFNEDYEPVLEEIRRFRAENGSFNTVDVTVEEHERFIIEWYASQGMKPPPGAIENLPGFYSQTQHAYQAMAAAGGGVWKSLTKDEQINQQILILAFGTAWQNEVAAFGRGLTARTDP